jgi:hypothetical protein
MVLSYKYGARLRLSVKMDKKKSYVVKPVMVEHTCNPSTQEVEVGRSQFQGQPGLYAVDLESTGLRVKETTIEENQ